MLFRPATPQDAVAISALVQTLSRDFVLNPDGSGAEQFWSSVSAKAQEEYITSPRYRYTLALSDSVLAGFIAIRDVGHVFHLFVAPEFQGRGLASALWNMAKNQANESGHSGPFTVNSSLTAISVYEHFGFQKIGEIVKMHGIAFQPMHLPI
jgi:ribosomal protein S18 acetylase RimI-like enzyme